MFQRLKTYTKKEINSFINKRKGETKLGEKIAFINSKSPIDEQILNSPAKYVLLGIPEDIGVTANKGKIGTRHAWEATLNSLLNIQYNNYSKTSDILLLGYLDFNKEMFFIDQQKEKEENDSVKIAKQFTAQIDKEVAFLIQFIKSSGKTPIVIGGGHNNAYGIIKGCALALNKTLNVVNIDAHTDLRSIKGRHSGNAFSYALRDGFLKKYVIYGLHENYTPQKILEKVNQNNKHLRYYSFESLKIRKEFKTNESLNEINSFIGKNPFGLEIDCDAIQNIPSSAMTPSGFNVNKVRKLIHFFSNHPNIHYLHICEAAPAKNNLLQMQQVGKLIAYFISDFIK